MTINAKLITTAVDIVQELFSDDTGEDLQTIKTHFGLAYNEGKVVAETAVKLVLRLADIQTASNNVRDLSPVDVLVNRAEDRYRSRYAL